MFFRREALALLSRSIERSSNCNSLGSTDQCVRLNALLQKVFMLNQASEGRRAEVFFSTKNRARNWEDTLRQHDLVVRNHHRKVRPLHERADAAEKATTNIEDRLKTVFYLRESLYELKNLRPANIGQFVEVFFSEFCVTPESD